MADISHWVGNDLEVAPNGDLLTVDGHNYGTQRIIRRLVTVAGTYLWHLDYGAGLPKRVGDKLLTDILATLITSQIYLEAQVARDPAPIITVEQLLNGVNVKIVYTDAVTSKPLTLAFDVNANAT